MRLGKGFIRGVNSHAGLVAVFCVVAMSFLPINSALALYGLGFDDNVRILHSRNLVVNYSDYNWDIRSSNDQILMNTAYNNFDAYWYDGFQDPRDGTIRKYVTLKNRYYGADRCLSVYTPSGQTSPDFAKMRPCVTSSGDAHAGDIWQRFYVDVVSNADNVCLQYGDGTSRYNKYINGSMNTSSKYTTVMLRPAYPAYSHLCLGATGRNSSAYLKPMACGQDTILTIRHSGFHNRVKASGFTDSFGNRDLCTCYTPSQNSSPARYFCSDS